MPISQILRSINNEDKTVSLAVERAIPQIEVVCEAIVRQIKNGGRLFYIGAGTSGRLGVLDASECPPTYGVPHGLVIGIISGGDEAIRKAVEHAEDSTSKGWKDLKEFDISKKDFVIGIAASGTTPYVVAAVKACKEQHIPTACVTNNKNSPLALEVEYPIEVVVGAEFITGSSRMKAGTSQKLILNMISTTVMIQLGHVKDKYISELLYNHDCVVVPNFGAFVANYRESEYHASTGMMYPPKKEIVFNPLLKVEDGLLINYICSKTDKSRKIVVEEIKTVVYEWERLIENRKNIVLENVGKIWVDEGSHIRFEPSSMVNYLSSSYGLTGIESAYSEDEPLDNVENYQESPQNIPLAPPPTKKINTHSKGSNISDMEMKYPNIKWEKKSNYRAKVRDANQPSQKLPSEKKRPLKKKKEGIGFFFIFLTLSMIGLIFYELYDYGYLDKTMKKTEKEEILPNPPKVMKIDPIPALESKEKKPTGYITKKKYHVMAGAYKTKRNALEQLKLIKNTGFLEADYIGVNKKGLHEITYGSFDSVRVAKKLLNIVQITNDEFSWLKVIEKPITK
ncbi:N-acetylmuramic acid 6-phosphate etherase [Elysia marginata]|uniref:N-acetylmuramic acid 6-phosphate etherase n=1 Tax=Elysia marginata TaxID=1093978 RepID=A0AAV4FRF2_9GAST|nr:N-acetylmuramic acid 6-phosphate etherase [Elysia marginata]